jgi:hypothetical protein
VRRCGGAEVRRCGGAEVRRCGGAEVRRCGSAEVRKCGSAEVRKCGSAEVRKCGSTGAASRSVIQRPGHRAPSSRAGGRRAEESTFGYLEAGRGSRYHGRGNRQSRTGSLAGSSGARGCHRPRPGANDAVCGSDPVTCRLPGGANEFAAGNSQSPPSWTRRPGRVRRPMHRCVRNRGLPHQICKAHSWPLERRKIRLRGLEPRLRSMPTDYEQQRVDSSFARRVWGEGGCGACAPSELQIFVVVAGEAPRSLRGFPQLLRRL